MLGMRELGFVALRPERIHHAELTTTEAWAYDTLRTWCQRGYAMPAQALADWLGLSTRETRRLVNHLIDRRWHGLPLAGVPGQYGGYFVPQPGALATLASTAVGAQLRRAASGALKARDMGATAQELSQSMVALTLDLGQEVADQVAGRLEARRGPATHAQIKQALGRYASDPARFAREIADLRRAFGGVFVQREELARVLRQQTEAMIERALAVGEAI